MNNFVKSGIYTYYAYKRDAHPSFKVTRMVSLSYTSDQRGYAYFDVGDPSVCNLGFLVKCTIHFPDLGPLTHQYIAVNEDVSQWVFVSNYGDNRAIITDIPIIADTRIEECGAEVSYELDYSDQVSIKHAVEKFCENAHG